MTNDFISEFNEVNIRKAKRGCRCKICDNDLTEQDDVIYLKSFRLSAQPFHICFKCWDNINGMVNDYKQGK